MPPRVFFSFHYDDVASFRANVVRNHGLLRDTGTAGFIDASIWEDAELHGDNSVMRLIDSGLQNTSVTCVLIGTLTWQRKWVRYEVMKSYDRGNRLLGVHINGVRDRFQRAYTNGGNPFSYLGFYVGNNGWLTYSEKNNGQWETYSRLASKDSRFSREFLGKGYTLSGWVPCYDWVTQDGYNNFASWVESAK